MSNKANVLIDSYTIKTFMDGHQSAKDQRIGLWPKTLPLRGYPAVKAMMSDDDSFDLFIERFR